MLNCFMGAATASGARLEYRWERRLAAVRTNLVLGRLFQRNMQLSGRKMRLFPPFKTFGSTDMGNVSQLVPSIQPLVAVAPLGVRLHTTEFALAAASGRGIQGIIDSAKALAMTVADLVADSETVRRIKEDFQRQRKSAARSWTSPRSSS